MKLQAIYNKVELKMIGLLKISVWKEVTHFPDELGRRISLPVLQREKKREEFKENLKENLERKLKIMRMMIIKLSKQLEILWLFSNVVFQFWFLCFASIRKQKLS